MKSLSVAESLVLMKTMVLSVSVSKEIVNRDKKQNVIFFLLQTDFQWFQLILVEKTFSWCKSLPPGKAFKEAIQNWLAISVEPGHLLPWVAIS